MSPAAAIPVVGVPRETKPGEHRVAVTRNRAFWSNPEVSRYFSEWPEGARDPVLWTDDYSNLYSLLTLG